MPSGLFFIELFLPYDINRLKRVMDERVKPSSILFVHLTISAIGEKLYHQ